MMTSVVFVGRDSPTDNLEELAIKYTKISGILPSNDKIL